MCNEFGNVYLFMSANSSLVLQNHKTIFAVLFKIYWKTNKFETEYVFNISKWNPFKQINADIAP